MKRVLIDSLKFTGAVVVTIVFFEVFFITTEISLPSFVVDHPVLGRTFRANARTSLIQEGFYMGRVNDHGYLGPSYPPEKPSGTVRIALNGDSFVEAFQLFPRFNIRTILEAELAARVEGDVEVMNFGRSGQELRTMYTYYKDFAASFHPDIVLFILTDNSFRSQDKSIGPRCYLGEDGELRIDYGFAESEAYKRKIRLRSTRRLGSFQILQNALSRYRQGETVRILFDKFVPRNAPEEQPTRQSTSKDRYFELNSAVLNELGRVNRSGESRVVIVGHGHVPEYYLPVIEAAGLTYIDLNPELEALEAKGINPYYWPVTNSYGHWNHEGHKVIGRYLALRLQEMASEELPQ